MNKSSVFNLNNFFLEKAVILANYYQKCLFPDIPAKIMPIFHNFCTALIMVSKFMVHRYLQEKIKDFILKKRLLDSFAFCIKNDKSNKIYVKFIPFTAKYICKCLHSHYAWSYKADRKEITNPLSRPTDAVSVRNHLVFVLHDTSC